MAKMPNYYKIHTDGCTVALEPIYEELVSAVRCKDCEYYDFDDGYCGYTDGFNNKEHFCSYGKRRINATD